MLGIRQGSKDIMTIKVTQWGLDTYIGLVKKRIILKQDYDRIIRPDALLLKKYPSDPKFQNSNFFHPAGFNNGVMIPNGYKMKWGNIGPGTGELRVCVAILNGIAYICEGYAKTDERQEQRMLIRFQGHIGNIKNNNFTECGELT